MKRVFHKISLIGVLRFTIHLWNFLFETPISIAKKHRTKAYFSYVQSALQYDILPGMGRRVVYCPWATHGHSEIDR